MHNSRRSLQEIHHWLRQLLPSRGYKRLLDFLPLAIVGAVFSMSCHLNRIAVALVFAGGHERFLQRLRRWVLRETFVVDEVLWRAVGACLAPRPAPIVLLVDRTEWGDHNLLYAAVPFRGRALPVAVDGLPDGATHHTRLAALLDHAAPALPPGTPVVVVADREFGNALVLAAIRARGWHFCLRYKHDTWLQTLEGDRWQARDRFPRPGKRVLWSPVLVQEQRSGPWQVAVFWGPGEKEPWVLVSDLPAERLVPLYRQRMRIDEMFSDLKSVASTWRRPDSPTPNGSCVWRVCWPWPTYGCCSSPRWPFAAAAAAGWTSPAAAPSATCSSPGGSYTTVRSSSSGPSSGPPATCNSRSEGQSGPVPDSGSPNVHSWRPRIADSYLDARMRGHGR